MPMEQVVNFNFSDARFYKFKTNLCIFKDFYISENIPLLISKILFTEDYR